MTTLICPKCNKNYDGDKLRVYKCPDCKKWLDYGPDVHVQKYEPEQDFQDELDDLDPATRALAKAVNRTTYAIRSIALYLFITITTSFLGLLLIYLAPEAAVLGAFIILIGFVASVSVGISELSKSKP